MKRCLSRRLKTVLRPRRPHPHPNWQCPPGNVFRRPSLLYSTYGCLLRTSCRQQDKMRYTGFQIRTNRTDTGMLLHTLHIRHLSRRPRQTPKSTARDCRMACLYPQLHGYTIPCRILFLYMHKAFHNRCNLHIVPQFPLHARPRLLRHVSAPG